MLLPTAAEKAGVWISTPSNMRTFPQANSVILTFIWLSGLFNYGEEEVSPRADEQQRCKGKNKRVCDVDVALGH